MPNCHGNYFAWEDGDLVMHLNHHKTMYKTEKPIRIVVPKARFFLYVFCIYK